VACRVRPCSQQFAKCVTDKLIAQGHWADYIDPCSGQGLTLVHPSAQRKRFLCDKGYLGGV
jgi:hypothetical protein